MEVKMKKMKRMIVVLLAIVCIVSTFALSTSALQNGTEQIKNSAGTQIGYAQLWNVYDYYTLYAQTESTEGNVNYIAGQALVKSAIKGGWNYYFDEADVEYAESAYLSPISILEIDQTLYTPLEARGRFMINNYIKYMCYTYNLGNGYGVCDCGFANDGVNN